MHELLPVGQYLLDDGRAVVGLDEFQLRAAAREGWRLQAVADARLEFRLHSQRRNHAAPPVTAKPAVQFDLLAGPI